MAASDHLHDMQLAMFMPAREIMRDYHPHPGDLGESETGGSSWGSSVSREETPAELWERKAEESTWISHKGQGYGYADEDSESLYEAVRRDGVQHPIPLFHGVPQSGGMPRGQYVANGHHRVAAAADSGLEVPVEHYGDPTFGGPTRGINAATAAADDKILMHRKRERWGTPQSG